MDSAKKKKLYYRNNSSKIDLKYRLKNLQACLNASIEVDKEKYCFNTANKLIITQKNYRKIISKEAYNNKEKANKQNQNQMSN